MLGTNQTLISRKMQEQVKQQNQTGHVYVRISIDTGGTPSFEKNGNSRYQVGQEYTYFVKEHSDFKSK